MTLVMRQLATVPVDNRLDGERPLPFSISLRPHSRRRAMPGTGTLAQSEIQGGFGPRISPIWLKEIPAAQQRSMCGARLVSCLLPLLVEPRGNQEVTTSCSLADPIAPGAYLTLVPGGRGEFLLRSSCGRASEIGASLNSCEAKSLGGCIAGIRLRPRTRTYAKSRKQMIEGSYLCGAGGLRRAASRNLLPRPDHG